MSSALLDTLRSVDRLLEDTVTHASRAALSEDQERGRSEAARAAHAANNARQIIIFLIENHFGALAPKE